jgi:hypothetical protein
MDTIVGWLILISLGPLFLLSLLSVIGFFLSQNAQGRGWLLYAFLGISALFMVWVIATR